MRVFWFPDDFEGTTNVVLQISGVTWDGLVPPVSFTLQIPISFDDNGTDIRKKCIDALVAEFNVSKNDIVTVL